jgi:hypothetical protein
MAAVADGLLAAGQAERVDGELAADGASELRGDIVLRQRAGSRLVMLDALFDDRVLEAYLMSSACASVRVNDAAISRCRLGQAVAHPVNVEIQL